MDSQFNTYLLDEALIGRKEALERERQATLEQVKQWLAANGSKYGIEKAYIFGSLVRPNRFTKQSDIDLAVEYIEPEQLFMAMTALAEAIGREVDLIELPQCPFAHRIRQEGILWTKTP
jgi:predicted nucleotidyltransferase